jgi:low affinity Fe/Cu permease
MKTVLKINLLLITVLLFNACKRDMDIVPEKIDKGLTLKLSINYKVDST